MARNIYAYSFQSNLSLAEMLSRLNAIGAWQWIERDNDNWGEYIAAIAVAPPDHGGVKILIEEDHYVINVSLECIGPEPQTIFDEVKRQVFETLLPALGAQKVSKTEDYQS